MNSGRLITSRVTTPLHHTDVVRKTNLTGFTWGRAVSGMDVALLEVLETETNVLFPQSVCFGRDYNFWDCFISWEVLLMNLTFPTFKNFIDLTDELNQGIENRKLRTKSY